MLQQSYVRAIMQAGGVPVLIPSSIAEDGWDALYARLDGVLLSAAEILPRSFPLKTLAERAGLLSSILPAIRIPASMMWTRHGIRLN